MVFRVRLQVRWGDLVPGRDKATCIRRWKLIAKKVPVRFPVQSPRHALAHAFAVLGLHRS